MTHDDFYLTSLVKRYVRKFIKYSIPKITAKQYVKNILPTFQPLTGATFDEKNVQQKIEYRLRHTETKKNDCATRSDGHVLNKWRGKDFESKFKLGFIC